MLINLVEIKLHQEGSLHLLIKMIKLKQILSETPIGVIHKDVHIDVVIDKTKHATKRQHRKEHGEFEFNDDVILEMVDKFMPAIIDAILKGMIRTRTQVLLQD